MPKLLDHSIILPGYEHIPLYLNRECNYLHDYEKICLRLRDQKIKKDDWYRALIEEDLFFIVYFHLKIKKANHPFVVARCNEVQLDCDVGNTDLVDMWAREHFKSTILTTAFPVQKILKDKEQRICIFSFKRENALKFFLPIKQLFERDSNLHRLYPNTLDPDTSKYPMWTRDLGITVKRDGLFREPTLMWSALNEGMPTGSHFTGKIYDDIMTEDMAKSPAEIEKSKNAFDMSQNLVDSEMEGQTVKDEDLEWQIIAGTPYHFNDIFKHLAELKEEDGGPSYRFRRYPATHNGKADGKPVLFTQRALDKRKRNKKHFSSQQLLRPVSEGDGKLNGDYLVPVSPDQLPSQLFKFLLVDPAGDEDSMVEKGKGNKWAVALLGVEPFRDDFGLSSVYILKLFLSQTSLPKVMKVIQDMYLSAGRIAKLGVEKVATSTYEVHIVNTLKKFNVTLSVQNKRLHLLRPGHRNKEARITGSLQWPLENGKWHYLNTINSSTMDSLKEEMNQFPMGGDDGIDILSYIYDMIKDYKFPAHEAAQANTGLTRGPDIWLDDETSRRTNSLSWMTK